MYMDIHVHMYYAQYYLFTHCSSVPSATSPLVLAAASSAHWQLLWLQHREQECLAS